jgi:transcription initiation factor IIE alpha subunit
VKVVDALIAAGLLTEEEARVPLVVTRQLTAENLAALPTDELIAEHRRRAEELAWRMVS